MIFKIKLVILLLFININSIESKCLISIRKADECAKHITFIGDPDVNIPHNDSDLDELCKSMLDAVKCLHDFGHMCLPPFPRQALGILTYNLRKVITRRCKRRQEREKFLEFTKCLVPKEKLHKTNICVDKHIIQLEYIKDNVGPEYTIPGICCTFFQRNECILREVSLICDHKNVDYLTQIIDDSTKDITNFACGRYNTAEACDHFFSSSVWGPLKDIVNTNDEKLLASRHKHKSILAPILAIITQFDI